MITLDHLILRVRDRAASLRFYQQIFGFAHVGRVEPFDVVRVNDGLTLDLMEDSPKDPLHLAFSLDRTAFEATHRRLVDHHIPFGNSPFDRNNGPPAASLGARGLADALYFYDPDGHNLEIRLYGEPP